MNKKIFSLLMSIVLLISVFIIPVNAENESINSEPSTTDDTSKVNENVGIIEILPCTEGSTSYEVGRHELPKDFEETIRLIPNIGYSIWGVEINGVFQALESDTIKVQITVGKTISIRPVFRGNITFKIEQSEGGRLSPEDTVYIGTGKHFEVTATPDLGYVCTGIYINNVKMDHIKDGNQYKLSYKATFEATHTVRATFEPVEMHTVTLNKNDGGKVLPFDEEGKAYVQSGDDAQFQILPDEGFGIKSVKVNNENISWSANGIFTVPDVSGDFTINVEFEEMQSIPVLITNIGNGKLTPAEKAYLNTILVLDVLPEANHELVNVKVNGALKALNSDGKLEIAVTEELFSLEKIEIEALFDVVVEKFIIRTVVQNSIGGTIFAEGYIIDKSRTEVRKGGEITLSFVPDMNYVIEKVKIDNVEVQLTEENTYTLKNVNSSHNVIVYFTPGGDDFFNVSVIVGEGGQASPFGEQLVRPGERISITITPDEGYIVDYILLNDEKIYIDSNVYDYENVIIDSKIEIFFKLGENSENTGNIDWNSNEISFDISQNTVIKKPIFDEIRNKGKGKPIKFIANNYMWTFPANSKFPYDNFDFGITIGKDKVSKQVIEALENKMVESKIQGFEYEVIKTSGISLDAEAILSLTLNSNFYGKELDYLSFDMKTGKFESVISSINEKEKKYDSIKVNVSEDGKVNLPYNGDEYIILVVSSTSKFVLNVIVGEHGSASPRGEHTVLINTNQTIQISPDPGYKVKEILINGVSAYSEFIGKNSSFSISLGKINNNYTLEINFEPDDTISNYNSSDIIDNTENDGLKPWAVALIIIGIALVGGVILFIYKWNAEKDIVD